MTILDVRNLVLYTLLPIIVGGLAVWAAASILRRQVQRQAWNELASLAGLTFEPQGFFSPMWVTGQYRGRNLVLDTCTRGRGRYSTVYTRILVSVNNSFGLSLELYEQSALGEIAQALGAQDIQAGNASLDRRFVIKGRPEDAIVSVLAAGNLSDKLMAARSVDIRVNGREVRFEQRGTELDIRYVQFLFDLLNDLADAIERAGGPGPAFSPWPG